LSCILRPKKGGSGAAKTPNSKKPISPPNMKTTISDDEMEDIKSNKNQFKDSDDDENNSSNTPPSPPRKINMNKTPVNNINKTPVNNGGMKTPVTPVNGIGSSTGKKEVYEDVLSELDESLQNKLPTTLRQKLLTYLRSRIESLKDPTKRAGTVSKIAERLGDTNYWIDYAARL
jgi:hypothetical protein